MDTDVQVSIICIYNSHFVYGIVSQLPNTITPTLGRAVVTVIV